jgi:hypothetical protein
MRHSSVDKKSKHPLFAKLSLSLFMEGKGVTMEKKGTETKKGVRDKNRRRRPDLHEHRDKDEKCVCT